MCRRNYSKWFCDWLTFGLETRKKNSRNVLWWHLLTVISFTPFVVLIEFESHFCCGTIRQHKAIKTFSSFGNSTKSWLFWKSSAFLQISLQPLALFSKWKTELHIRWPRKLITDYSMWNQFSSKKDWAKLTWKRKKGQARTYLANFETRRTSSRNALWWHLLTVQLVILFTPFVILVESESHFCRGTMSWTMQSNWKPSAHRGIRQKVETFWKSCFSVTDRLEILEKQGQDLSYMCTFKEISAIMYNIS